MLFNSFVFAVFLPLVFVLYWAYFNRSNLVYRNAFLLLVSYIFYGWWDWRFLSLIVISSLIDYFVGLKIGGIYELEESSENQKSAKNWLWVSIASNLGILGFFKYFNFFADSFVTLFAKLGVSIDPFTLKIVLPVGISFYTFQTMSYTIDVYRKEMSPTKDFWKFFAFVSFFPQLVAGPIERAKNLLPQFDTLKKPDYLIFRSALLLIAWGFFKKLMIADRIAVLVDGTFSNSAAASGQPMLMGAVFFALQLYLDFSAYSDIAIGTAKLFGFDLMTNFKRPYLSSSFADFWKRWHISLSTWFMDYVYIPLGGNRLGSSRTMVNILIVFAVSGLWHGASWNFVVWGLLNALFMIALDPILNAIKMNSLPTRIIKAAVIFITWTLSLVFFRAQGFQPALDVFANLGTSYGANVINFGLNAAELKFAIMMIFLLFVVEIFWERSPESVPDLFFKFPSFVRWIFYILILLGMVFYAHYGNGNEHSFIYFQF